MTPVDPPARAGRGNPCPIVIDAASLSAAQMQGIAAHYGQESGFVVGRGAEGGDGRLRLRFFVLRHEMAMCVHAMIAAVTGLAAAGRLDSDRLEVITASGPCRIGVDGSIPPEVTVEQQPPYVGPPVAVGVQLAQALRLPPGAIDDRQPIRAVSVSQAKLIVPLRRAEDVHSADPELELLWQVCREQETTGA